jgi:RNase P subunit RPR2
MKLYCKECGKLVMDIRDASVRNGVVCYCKECDPYARNRSNDIPEIFQSIFGDTSNGTQKN